jgi:hypothetical protein
MTATLEDRVLDLGLNERRVRAAALRRPAISQGSGLLTCAMMRRQHMLLHIRNPDLRAAETPRPTVCDLGRRLRPASYMACFHALRRRAVVEGRRQPANRKRVYRVMCWIAKANIEHFKKLLETEKDPRKRAVIERELVEEEAKLAAIKKQGERKGG